MAANNLRNLPGASQLRANVAPWFPAGYAAPAAPPLRANAANAAPYVPLADRLRANAAPYVPLAAQVRANNAAPQFPAARANVAHAPPHVNGDPMNYYNSNNNNPKAVHRGASKRQRSRGQRRKSRRNIKK